MSCNNYILNDTEVTSICANYLRILNALIDLRIIFGDMDVDDALLANIVVQLQRIDFGLEEFRPLVEQLVRLQEE